MQANITRVRVADEFIFSPYQAPRHTAPGQNFKLEATLESSFVHGGRRVAHGQQDTRRPKVSIITVCRNAARTLPAAIDSVRRQTFQDFEHIVVDGVSTDRTVALLESYGSDIEYFVSTPDTGIYHAMNRGLSLARGEYIAILNADDWFNPKFLEVSLDAIARSNADISYSDYTTERGHIKCAPLSEALCFSQLDVKHNTFLMSRKAFDVVGVFDENYRIVSDAKWNRAAYFSGLEFVHIAQPLVFYSSAGASSAPTEAAKKRIISESKRLIREMFPLLGADEAEDIYLSNFNNHSLEKLARIHSDARKENALLASALKKFALFNFSKKESYIIDPQRDHRAMLRAIAFCRATELPLASVRLKGGLSADLAATFNQIDLQSCGDAQAKPVALHFARVFSAPSETFIHKFVLGCSRRLPEYRHVMLCDERRLEAERPYADTVCVPWASIEPALAKSIYELLWARLQPRLMINHFALNGYHLWKRLPAELRRLPTINMCHGVDVFAGYDEGDYRRYLIEYCKLAPNVAFTAVSDFLAGQLEKFGMPTSKIYRVANTVDPTFHENRKASGFWQPKSGRPLKILSVGRLIDWKGHRFLIEALGAFAKAKVADFELTIVYANWEGDLAALRRLAERLSIDQAIKFVPFVNFDAEPGYFSQFDIFVLPSTLDGHVPPRTETFGVSALEAIAAGLPVIGTTAGGIPEVIGEECAHGRIVVHGDAGALYSALHEAVANHGRTFSDNAAYASGRLAAFSESAAFGAFRQVVEAVTAKRKCIVHFSSLTEGGAAGATINIHTAMLAHGIDSIFVTRNDRKVSPYLPNVEVVQPQLGFSFDQGQNENWFKSEITVFSVDDRVLGDDTLDGLADRADAIVVGWHGKLLSARDIARLAASGKPILIVLRDMNPITGGCHYFHSCTKWTSDCRMCPQLKCNDDDFPASVLDAKILGWARPNVGFVALSKHSMATLERAAVSKDHVKFLIGNLIDPRSFYPEPHVAAKKRLGLSDRHIAVGYLPSFGSSVKGADEFRRAMYHLSSMSGGREFEIVVGGALSVDAKDFAFPVRNLFKLNTPGELREFYSALDVLVVPSLEETFSNTVLEALACGTPVAGFQTGVLPELLFDPVFGSAVPVGDCKSLSEAILTIASTSRCEQQLHEFVASRHSIDSRVHAYLAAFDALPTLQTAPIDPAAQQAIDKLGQLQMRRKAQSTARLYYARSSKVTKLERELAAVSRKVLNLGIANGRDANPTNGSNSRAFYALRGAARTVFRGGVPPWAKKVGKVYLQLENWVGKVRGT